MELDFILIVTCILVFLTHLPPVVTFSPSLESSCICQTEKVSNGHHQQNGFLPACCLPRRGRQSFSAGAVSSSPSPPAHHLPLAMQAPPCATRWFCQFEKRVTTGVYLRRTSSSRISLATIPPCWSSRPGDCRGEEECRELPPLDPHACHRWVKSTLSLLSTGLYLLALELPFCRVKFYLETLHRRT